MRRRDLFLPSKCQIWGCPDVKRGAWLENLPSWLPFDSQFSQKLGEFAVFIWVLRSYGSSLGYSMVCIEEVGSWFRELYPPKRLELMCSLLQMCLPLELRFIGSYVEDLAKKDYYYLRDAENRANDPQEVKKLMDIFDRETRAKMTTYLALMHSSNTVCSSALYTTLTCILLPALERNNHIITNNLHRDVQSDNFCSEIFLMLTMAAYHPSFSFRQRHRLACELHSFQKLFEDRLSPGSASVSREHSPPSTERSSSSSSNSSSSGSVSGSQRAHPGGTPASSATCHPETNSIPAAHSNATQSNATPATQSNATATVQSNATPHEAQRNAMPTPVNNGIECSPTVSPTRSPVYVQNVEVKGCQVRDRKSEFVIQVTWSDGHVVETCRTYQQLQQFHAELLKLFPKDAGAHKQERQIPFLPQDKGPSTNHTELEAHIKKYIGQLSVLQDHIVKCDHVTAFFRSTPTSAPAAPPASVQTDVVTTDTTDVSASSPASLSSVSTSPLTITVESGQMSGGHSPRLLPTYAATNSPTSAYSSVGYPMHHQGSPSSSGSSPLVSPSSSGGYPAMPLVSPRNDIASWLKTIRLHKYTHQLCRFTFDELAMMSEQQLEQEGLTVGARKKFTTEMLKWRPAPNGIIFDGSCPQSPYHTPPHSYTASPLAELHQGGLSGNLSGVDSSSVGSECSSPPNSPILERKQRRDSMSSEETDKENPPTDASEGLDVSDGLLPTPPPIMPLHMLPDQVPLGVRPNGGVLGLPPGVRDGPPTSAPFMPLHHRAGPMDIKALHESMLHQYPPGVRPLLPLFDNCCPPRGPPLRTMSRGPLPQSVQTIRTLPLPIHTTAAPVMPSPNGSLGGSAAGAGVVFENGHHQPLGPAQSYTYVPNHSHGPLPHAHPPPLGAVPHNHPPTKVNGQYADPTMTAGLTSSTDTPTHNGKGPVTYIPQMNSSPGGVLPLTTVSGPSVLTWPPSSVNTMASTSLTYSIVQMPPSHDSNGKTATLQAPTMSTHSSPGGSTYSTPPPPGPASLQRAKSSSPPMAHSATSVQHHPATIATVSATSSSCSSCGCNCNNSTAGTPTPTPTPPPPPQQQQQPQPPPPPPPAVVASASMGPPPPPPPPPHAAYNQLWYMQQAAMWHNSHHPYLAAANSNGLITHNMPFQQIAHTHHHPPTINGLSTDVLYHPHNLWLGTHMTGGNGGPYAATGTYAHHNTGNITNGSNSSSSSNGGNGSGKKSQCYNCGQTGHWAADCKEPTMDAMSHSGTFHLKFRPKSQDAE